MLSLNVDFHIHSKYSGGTSQQMELPTIASQAQLKGLEIVGTGDALHNAWLEHIKEMLREEGEGIYIYPTTNTRFIITGEVEDIKRVHHLILFPSLSSAEDMHEKIKGKSVDLDQDGRPHVQLNGEELVDIAKDSGALIGPAHAFTPWTAIYKEYRSLRECYGDQLSKIHFLELGLSADTEMADRIEELQNITFMSNSDAHSPWPHRLGREFNRLVVKDFSFREITKAIKREQGRGFSLNVGLNPLEGKYHKTACTRCYLHFLKEDAIALKLRCPECGGLIKIGVADRIEELASWKSPHHPSHRPPYIHILPLAEIIALAYNTHNLNSKRVREKWTQLVKSFGSEIKVLLDVDVGEIKKVDARVGEVIENFRKDKVRYIPGGGGKYGTPTLGAVKERVWGQGQRKLSEF